MRRDSIFYSLFKQSPSSLFELLSEVPDSAARYRFESVAVKEPTFIIDGVFLPPESEESEAAEKARMLIERANQEVSALSIRQGIIEMISTIMVYKFINLSRQEIDAMLGTKFEETRVYREAKEEKAQEIALNLLRQGLSIESIAQATGLTVTQLQEMQNQLS
jgi:predicted transposase YdaD